MKSLHSPLWSSGNTPRTAAGMAQTASSKGLGGAAVAHVSAQSGGGHFRSGKQLQAPNSRPKAAPSRSRGALDARVFAGGVAMSPRRQDGVPARSATRGGSASRRGAGSGRRAGRHLPPGRPRAKNAAPSAGHSVAMADNVKVAVRVRPFNGREKGMGAKCIVRMEGSETFLTDPTTGAPCGGPLPRTPTAGLLRAAPSTIWCLAALAPRTAPARCRLGTVAADARLALARRPAPRAPRPQARTTASGLTFPTTHSWTGTTRATPARPLCTAILARAFSTTPMRVRAAPPRRLP